MLLELTTGERCTAALLLDVDSVGLVRGKGGPDGEGGLAAAVRQRPPLRRLHEELGAE